MGEGLGRRRQVPWANGEGSGIMDSLARQLLGAGLGLSIVRTANREAPGPPLPVQLFWEGVIRGRLPLVQDPGLTRVEETADQVTFTSPCPLFGLMEMQRGGDVASKKKKKILPTNKSGVGCPRARRGVVLSPHA